MPTGTLVQKLVYNEEFSMQDILKGIEAKGVDFSNTGTTVYRHMGCYFYEKAEQELNKPVKKLRKKLFFESADNSKTCFEKVEDSNGLDYLTKLCADFYIKLSEKGSDIATKKEHIEKALELYKKMNDEGKISLAYRKLGKLAERKSDYIKAIEYYKKAGNEKAIKKITDFIEKRKQFNEQVEEGIALQEERIIKQYYNQIELFEKKGMNTDQRMVHFEKVMDLIKKSSMTTNKKYEHAKLFNSEAHRANSHYIRNKFKELVKSYEIQLGIKKEEKEEETCSWGNW